MTGKIIKGIGGFYYVHDGYSRIYECRAKGIFRNQNRKPLVGDNVIFDVLDEEEGTGNIRELLPRVSELSRPVAANVDQALVVFACRRPDPTWLLLDRYLVMLEEKDLPALVCFTKLDLADGGCLPKEAAGYRTAGYPVFGVSSETGEGMEEVKNALRQKTTILAGPSGVGKSTLLNALVPDAGMETGQVSEKIGRGRNTTRHSEIFLVEENTFLMDTPGFSVLFPPEMEPEDLKNCFPEFLPYEGRCRFNGCNHLAEPDCAVKAALSKGKISASRYKSYAALFEELKQQKRY